MPQTTAQQRVNWQEFECNEHKLIEIAFGPDRIRVAPPTRDAWRALATVLRFHDYKIRPADTSSYNCRQITAGSGKSLHSYGIALDVNASTNPFVKTPDGRAARFSNKATQEARAQDVRLKQADTDMTPQMVADVRAIKTKNGNVVFDWGGNWNDRKDPMHFEIDVSPADLQTGIDWSTVKGADGEPQADVAFGHDAEARPIRVAAFAGELGAFQKCTPVVEKWEGQFGNDPDDPGGPTNMGVTQEDLARFRQRPIIVDEVRDLTREEARRILREFYWKPIHGDELPLPAAQMCYDAAVLTGVRRAGRSLQEALNRQGNDIATDGIIDRAMIGAALKADPKRLVDDFAATQEAYLRSRPGFPKYGKGWLNRLNDVRSVATAMAIAAPPRVAAPSPTPSPVPSPAAIPAPVPIPLPVLPAHQPGETMASDQDLRLLTGIIGALAGKPLTPPGTPSQPSPDGAALQQLLPIIIGALAAKPVAGSPAVGGAAAGQSTPPVLSGIDNALGGLALAGKKTAIGIIAYVILSILQATGNVGTATGEPYRQPAVQTPAAAPTTGAAALAQAPSTTPTTPGSPSQVAGPPQGGGTKTPTGGVLTTLIAAFTGLGLIGKIDRIVKALGLAASKAA